MIEPASSRLSTGQKAGVAAAALIPLLVLGFFLVRWLVPHQGENTLAGIRLAQPGVVASPTGLINADDTDTLARITNDGSLFGLPLAVRVVRVAEPMTQPETQEAAETYYRTTPIETADGAQDGLLFYIAVPLNAPRAATAAFVPGANFFPQNGLTQERLDRTLSEVVQPRLAQGNYADAAKQGAAWVVYDQLFGTYPRVPLSHSQEALNHLTNRVLAPLVAVAAAAYIGLAFWTRRAARRNRGRAADAVGSAFAAGAIARGRADDALPTAALLSLFERGHLRIDAARKGIAIGPEPEVDDPFVCAIWERARELAEHAGGTIPMRAVSRLDDAFAPQLAYVRTRLVQDGQFSSRIPGLNRVVWGTGAALLLLAVYLLVPSLVSRAAAGFLVAIATVIVVVGVLWWSVHRSRSTESGARAAAAWLATQQDAARSGDAEAIAALRTYRLILRQEDLIADRSIVAEDYGRQAPRFLALIRGMSVA